MYLIQIAVILVCFITSLECVKFSSLDTTYYKGVEAYSKERWSECIVQFEEALHLHKLYSSILINCRLQCNSKRWKPLVNENIEDLKIYDYFLNTRDCLTKCQSLEFEKVRLLHNATNTVLTQMHLKKPYQFLHICYFQMNALPKAASAAYTYLVANPDDEDMKKNFDYYIGQPEVDVLQVQNLEVQDYKISYTLGVKAYNLNNWHDTIINMENALTSYLASENSCRVECENQPEQEWSSEFYISVSYNVASLLSCRQNCQNQLKPFYNSGIEFLAHTLNYIQISYYHLDKLNDAAKSVASYLILMPNDEDMLSNKDIYRTLVDDGQFSARSEIEYYLTRDQYEKQLLNFFHKEDPINYEANTV